MSVNNSHGFATPETRTAHQVHNNTIRMNRISSRHEKKCARSQPADFTLARDRPGIKKNACMEAHYTLPKLVGLRKTCEKTPNSEFKLLRLHAPPSRKEGGAPMPCCAREASQCMPEEC